MIRVLICDDQTIVCEGLQVILESAPDIKVVGQAHDGAHALEQIVETRPDLVLMDLKMPGMNGVRATREIRQHHPHIRVLVLTTYDEDEWVFDAIRNGASGYLLKNVAPADLIKAVRGTMSGHAQIDPAVAGKLLTHIAMTDSTLPSVADEIKISDLTERELEILAQLGSGLSNEEIAGRLHLSMGTVRNYVSSIFSKLSISDRTQAALIAVRYGLTNSH
ncbi:MAG: response regulator transcription factor [Chloroflexi bacterium]|nr:response regulator transcription factor [Chloroflexota bacterium]